MRKKAISISSDSHSDDDVPLKLIKTNRCTDKPHSYNSFGRHHTEECDDDVPLKFIKTSCTDDPNSYDSLCQRSIEECEFCDRISKNRYSSLIHNVSHIIIPLLNQKVIQCPICLFHFTSQEDLKLHNLKKHPELKAVAKVSLVKIESDTSRIILEPSRSIKNELPKLQESQSIPTNSTVTTTTGSIKNRLIFEDDDLISLDCNQLLNDLTTDCKVNIEMFDTPDAWMNGDQYTKSVHYDELVNPGVYRCRKCGKRFPTRYDTIIHESSHIVFKNSQIIFCVKCYKYILGGLKDLRFHEYMFHGHILEKPAIEDPKKLIMPCQDENMRGKRVFNTQIMNFCELCFFFCKNRSSTNYECIKSVCEVGKRFPCDKCGQLFFEIKIVRKFVQQRMIYQTRKRKKKTNEDRLKTIAHRFKMMKH